MIKDKVKTNYSHKFTDEEFALFKNVFCEQFELMRIISNVFLQLELTESEKALITNTFKGKTELLKLMRKKLIAELDPKSPLGLNSDIWSQVVTTNVVPELFILDVQAKQLVLELLEEGLKSLEDINYKPVVEVKKLTSNFGAISPEQSYINIRGRNDFINHVNAQMSSILGLAGQSDDTVEKIKQRLENIAKANSAK